MTTNLDVLDQYVLCLQGTASKILELSLGPRGFPSEAVAARAKGPRACRAAVQMEAMGCGGPPWIQCSSRELYGSILNYLELLV